VTREVVWEVDLTAAAVKNKNLTLLGSPFSTAQYTGGSNETEAPARRMMVHFRNAPSAEMWVYGDKKILTPRVGPVGEFFRANNILAGKSVRLRMTQLAIGELKIERAI
jgi:hypothetical protein